MKARLTIIVAALHLTYAIHDADILALYKRWYTGDGTYYGYGNSGLCTYNRPSMPPVSRRVDKLVALNAPQMIGSSGCGLCFRVNGTEIGRGTKAIRGHFTAYVKDVCPECHAGALDLAENGDGRWKIHIQAVQCPVGTSKIQYVLQGSNGWYLKLQVRNERMPATTVEMYQPKHRAWVTLHRSSDGFWEFPSDSRIEKPISLPFKVRLHAPNGDTLVDTVHAPWMGYTGVISGNGVQFRLDPHLPSAETNCWSNHKLTWYSCIHVVLTLSFIAKL